MVERLTYNPIFRPAIYQVFGKTLICRDMDAASQFSKSADMDCITPEGRHCAVLNSAHHFLLIWHHALLRGCLVHKNLWSPKLL